MKKKIFLLFSSFLCMTQMFAYSFEEDGIFYNITSSANMTVEVTCGWNYGEYEMNTVSIPNSVQHNNKVYYVTRIGSHAFSGCTDIGRVIFNSYITSVGDYAFSGCNNITSITIPANVTSIDNYAFSGCFNLTSVNIEDSEQTLSLGYGSRNGSNYGLFADCPLSRFYWGRPLSYNTNYGLSPIANKSKLKDITIGPNVSTISAYMFYGNTAFSSITLPETVTALGSHAFDGFIGLKSFTIPKHITSIGAYAFAGCTGLTSFTIPKWITSIGTGTFSGCSSITSFTIPGHVKSIANRAFEGCTGIKALKFEPGTETLSLGITNYYDNGMADSRNRGLFNDCPIESVELDRELSYNAGSNWGYSPFANISSLKKFTIGDQLTSVYNYILYGCTYLTSVNLPETITTIGNYAFSGCTTLSSLAIPANVESIGECAFRDCTGFTAFKWGTGIKSVGYMAFSGCTGLTSLTIPGHVKSIANRAFEGCTGIKALKFEPGTETLSLGITNYYDNGMADSRNRGLFNDCPIESVELDRELSYNAGPNWGYSPLANISSLKKFTIGDQLTSVYNYILYGCTYLTSVNLPETITTIGNYAFSGCTTLSSLAIPANVESIGECAFRDCTGFTAFKWGTGIKSVGYKAFSGCTGLTSLTIPSHVKSIANRAFEGCTGIKALKFEPGTETLSLGITNYYDNGMADSRNRGLFNDCPIESIELNRNLNYLGGSNNGYSPFANIKTLKRFEQGVGGYFIGDYLLYNNKSIKNVKFSEGLNSIGKYAFAYCDSITSFLLPESLGTIDEFAFSNCIMLTGLIFHPALKSIGNYAFNGCTSLGQLTIEEGEETLSLGYNYRDGNSSDNLGKGLFNDCPLESVFIGRNLSYSTEKRCGYSPFAYIETLVKARLGNPVKSIQPYLFRGCSSFTTLNYNENCAPMSVDDYAFWGCTSLTESDIKLPESIKTIGEGAFRYCTSLEGYTIPNHVTAVGNYAFMNCEKLANVIIKPSVMSIGNFSFNGCTALSQLTIEEGEETLSLGYNFRDGNNSNNLGKGLFNDCPLESVFIGRNLDYNTEKRCGYSPFAYNKTLVKARLGNPVKSIQSFLFCNCNSFTTLFYNENCAPKSIGSYAFFGCDSVTSLSLPESIETIGDYAFSDCSQLTGLIFHPALKSIGNYVFRNCTAFNNFTFEESEETLTLGNGSSEGEKTGLFKDCPLTSVFIGRNLSYNYAPLSNIKTLEKARFGNPVTRIPNYIFQGDTELSSVVFNNSCQLQSVGKYAFDGCVNLSVPQFPNTVTVFDEGAFKGCTNFMNVELPENLVSIGSYTFQDCTGLTEFKFPGTITSIGNYAFSGCIGVKQVSFEDNEETTLSLGYGASKGKGYGLFNDCPLEELYLGRTVSYDINSNGTYGYSPFYKQGALISITVGTKVASLPYCIFFGTAIEEIYVPSSVRTIHSSAFNGCSNLKKVIILGATPPTGDTYNTMLNNTAEGSKFYVFFPEKYASIKPWNSYTDRITSICSFNDNFTYSGSSQTLTYQTEFPITLSNLETEVDAGTYSKRVEVTYSTNGHTMEDILKYDYSIDKAVIDVTVEDAQRVYGEENPEFVITLNGLVNNEDATALEEEPVATTKATSTSDAGTYDITVSGGKSTNYSFNYHSGTLTVLRASQEILWELPENLYEVGGSVELTAKASSGLAIEYDTIDKDFIQLTKKNNRVYATFLKEGLAHVTASQPGNKNYEPAESQIWTVEIVSTGIESIAAEEKDVQYIQMNGMYTNGLKKGLNIIRSKDGKAVKVWVK